MKGRIALLMFGMLGCGVGSPAGAEPDGARLVLEEPKEGVLVRGEFVVRGRVVTTGPVVGTVRVNDREAALVEARFEAPLVVKKDGMYAIHASWRRQGREPVSAVRIVDVDVTPPSLVIETPVEEYSSHGGRDVLVAGVAGDSNLRLVRMNGKTVPVRPNGYFASLFALPAQGEFRVEVEAIDAVEQATKTVRVLLRETGKQHVPLLPRPDSSSLRAMGQLLAADAAINAGLAWLTAHQSDTGGWEAAHFHRWCDGTTNPNADSAGPGREAHDVGVTGLAACAFLGAGFTGRGTTDADRSLRRALAYLMARQDGEGCIGSRAVQAYVYSHAFAALAMVEAFGRTGAPAYRASAQRALDFIAFARNPTGAWRYGVRPGDSDTSVTACMAAVLFTARAINRAAALGSVEPPLRVDEATFTGISSWLDEVTWEPGGTVGYQTRGGGPFRQRNQLKAFPPDRSESTTAMGLLCRLHAGEHPRTSKLLRTTASRLARRLPEWFEGLGYIDLFYWFFATQAAHLVGGELWRSWESALNKAILGSQRKVGDPCWFLGSWDPADPWGAEGGRVYSTAICILMLETRARALR